MKKFLSLVTVFVFVLLFSNLSSQASEVKNLEKAQKLQEYGILKGSNQGFQLENSLTRVEGSVMLVRLLGKEQEIAQNTYSHPFKDVPAWANGYVGYLYANGLAKGTSSTTFGSNDGMTASQYVTFLLRVLGYDDSKGDFSWNTSVEKAVEIGLIKNEDKTALLNKSVLLRDDMAGLSYDALNTYLKDSKTTLLNKLETAGVIQKNNTQKELTIEEKIKSVKDDMLPLW